MSYITSEQFTKLTRLLDESKNLAAKARNDRLTLAQKLVLTKESKRLYDLARDIGQVRD